jgi:hypothetical protein
VTALGELLEEKAAYLISNQACYHHLQGSALIPLRILPFVDF